MDALDDPPAAASLDGWYRRSIRRRRRLTREETDALMLTIERAHAAIAEHALASPIGLRTLTALAREVAAGTCDVASVVGTAAAAPAERFVADVARIRRLAAGRVASSAARARRRRLGREVVALDLRVEHVERVVHALEQARSDQGRAQTHLATLEEAGLGRKAALRTARAALARLEAESGMTLEALRHAVTVVHAARRQMRIARDILVESNLRLVGMVARKFRHQGLELPDLVQEGTIGLMRAVDRFDRARRVAFSTYAVWWIRQTMLRALSNRGRTVRLPVNLFDEMNVLGRERQWLRRKLGRTPSGGELAAASGTPVARVEELLRLETGAARTPISLDDPVDAESATTRLDVLADREGPTPADAATVRALAERALAALALLEPREREILALRFGLTGRGDHTLEEIGAVFGVTRQRILQITTRAIARLRQSAAAPALRTFYDP